MILPAQDITKYALRGMITPFYKKSIKSGMSFGLSQSGYDIRINENITLYPITLKSLILKALGFSRPSFVLASAIEKFDIPRNLLFVVCDKSTWARKGLAVQNTIGEAGWRGYLTLELSNHGDNILTIKSGDPIAQLVFHTLTNPTGDPYEGKYQDQAAGPQEAKYE